MCALRNHCFAELSSTPFITTKNMDFSAQRITGSLQNLDINFNKDGWGPVGGEKSSSFFGIPYAHFDKKDKIGRPADFTVQGSSAFPRQHFQKRREEHGATDFSYRYDAVEDSTFQLVDTTKAGSKTKHTGMLTMLHLCIIFASHCCVQRSAR